MTYDPCSAFLWPNMFFLHLHSVLPLVRSQVPASEGDKGRYYFQSLSLQQFPHWCSKIVGKGMTYDKLSLRKQHSVLNISSLFNWT